MEEVRTFIQGVLSTIPDIDCGVPIPDGMVETGKTYFGYTLQEDFDGTDLDNNYTMTITLNGNLVRRDDPTENTIQVIDEALEELKLKLKSMNFKYTYRDIDFDVTTRKINVRATATYNESNMALII